MLAHNLGEYSVDEAGETGFVSSLFPELAVMGRIPVRDDWALLPLLSFSPVAQKGPDGSTATRVLRASGRASYAHGAADFQAGLGVLNWIVSGGGGTVTLDNGNSTTEFGVPSDTSMASLFYWEAGVGLQYSRVRWDNSVLATGLLSSRRAVSFVTQLSIGVL